MNGERFHQTWAGLGWRIHWFRHAQKRLIRAKKRMQFQKYPDSCGKDLKLLSLAYVFQTSVLSLVLDMI